MNGSLFVSYSHLDKEWMHEIKRHLQGMLLGRVDVWTDEAIAPGTSWEEKLRGNLNHTSAGLVLASPNYLVSTWCRRELEHLDTARKERRIGAVYWVLLAPCGWSWCELKDLQAVQEPANRSLLEVPAGPERYTVLLRWCERIASGAISVAGSEDPALETVRMALRNVAADYRITSERKVISGDYSIVCHATKPSGEELYVKVLTNTPLHPMRKLFKAVTEACSAIKDPAVVQVEKVDSSGKDWDERIVILSEVARGEPLDKVIEADSKVVRRADRHLTVDTIRLILLRIARALHELHKLDPIPWPGGSGPAYQHIMGPLVPSNIFYDRQSLRPQISLVGVTNFLWHFFEPETFRRIVNPGSGTYLLPEKQPAPRPRADVDDTPQVDKQPGQDPGVHVDAWVKVGPKADQYFLGMLALELLEAKLLFKGAEGPPKDLLEYVEKDADSHWTCHAQLKKIVTKLLSENPEGRYLSMDEVVQELEAVEEMKRALAKDSFQRYIAPEGADESTAPEGGKNPTFTGLFYERFLRGNSEAEELFRREQKSKGEIPDAEQHKKLLDALKAVLNYRRGGYPSSVNAAVVRHTSFKLDDQQFDRFKDAFLDVLHERMRPKGIAEADEARIAWEWLFAPVLEEMKAARKPKQKVSGVPPSPPACRSEQCPHPDGT